MYSLGANSGRLRYLNLRGCSGITDAGIRALVTGCTRLRALDLGDLAYTVSDVMLSSLADHCPRLRRLSLRGATCVTDAGVRIVARRCSGLRQLNLQNCALVGGPGLSAVRQHCANCHVEHSHLAFY